MSHPQTLRHGKCAINVVGNTVAMVALRGAA